MRSKAPKVGSQHCWNYENDQSWSWHEYRCIEHNSCGGTRQSPVNIETLSVVHDISIKPLEFHGHDLPLHNFTVHNDGLSLFLRPSPADKTKRTVRGGYMHGTFEFRYAQFHWGSTSSQGSEHRVDGIAYPMEVQLVYTKHNYAAVGKPDQKYSVAIIATLYQVTYVDFDSVKAMRSILEVVESNTSSRGQRSLRHLLPWMVRRQAGHGSDADKSFPLTLNSLMPQADLKKFFTYRGSLTTPPCTESVRWTIFSRNAFISETVVIKQACLRDHFVDKQTAAFLADNFRPPQRLHGRKIIASFAPF
ncbi:hypothetical protein MTO96_002976 [Rhipicephalus appendiculatus]